MGDTIDTFVRPACNTPNARAYGARYFALSLISILALTHAQPVTSMDAAATDADSANNCGVANSDFGVSLKRLAGTVTQRTDIPPEFLQRYFAGCTIETIESFLAKNGFAAGDSALAFGDKEAGITRTVLAEKTMQLFGLFVSLNCRIILKINRSK